MIHFVSLAFIFCMFPIRMAQTCIIRNDASGVIVYDGVTKCWKIKVPQDSFVRLDLKTLTLDKNNYGCYDYVTVSVSGTKEKHQYSYLDSTRKPLTALTDVSIDYYQHACSRNTRMYFLLNYTIESLICGQEDHFRCSPSKCIHQHQVCDKVEDCVNGTDEIGCEKGIAGVRGMNISRENVTTWLKSQRLTSYGWGKNTHRAITALYLAKAAVFRGGNVEEELMVKELKLQTFVALLRNCTDLVSDSELSMFVNALIVTCHDPRKFYGRDLLQMLRDRVNEIEPPSPTAYLTLCNSNSTFSESDVLRLLKTLHSNSKYPFISDIQAVAVMALTCMKNKPHNFGRDAFSTSFETLYNRTINTLIAGQLSDGSFGNVYTTALVTQALIASEQENSEEWNITTTARYLMQQLNSSSIDFLSAYLTLPIFNGRSLVDITNVHCSNVTRKHEEDNEISDVMNRLGGKMRVQYSLYVGDQKDVVHTILLRMPENSSAYDVMRVAQVADPKYKFLGRGASGKIYVYEIAGIINDPEARKFWLLYSRNRNGNGTVEHHTKSPDEYFLKDDEHLIMWYKTADI